MASRKGTPREIATQGFSSVDPLGISTQGFREPVLGNVIIGGGAGFSSVYNVTAVGGLLTSGVAIVTEADTGTAGGDVITGGQAIVSFVRTEYIVIAAGGLITNGAAVVEYVPSTPPRSGRGGARITFEYAQEKRDFTTKELWDKLDKIVKDSLPKEYTYFGKSDPLRLSGSAKVFPIYHDEPTIQFTPTNDPSIILSLLDLFANKITPEEINKTDEFLVLHDLLYKANYKVEIEEKNLFQEEAKPKSKQLEGKASVSFVSSVNLQNLYEEECVVLDLDLLADKELDELDIL